MTMARMLQPSCRFAAALGALGIALLVFAWPVPALGERTPSAGLNPRQFGVAVDVEKDAEYAEPLCPNGNIHFTVRITNNSFGNAAGQILDPIPNGTTFVQGSAGGGAFHDALNNRVVWQGLLAPGQTHSIGFSVTVNQGMAGGSVFNVATGRLVVGEMVAQDQDQVAVPVGCAPLAVSVTKEPHLALPLCPGSNIHYSVRITNLSDRNRLLDARIEDPLPANAEFAGSLTPDTRLENNAVVWEGKLGPGQSHEIGFSVRVPDTAPDGTPINNRATATLEDTVVGDSAQNVHEVVNVVDCPEDELGLGLEKSSDFDGPLCPGSRIRYEITLTNTSETQGLLRAEIVDPLPEHTKFANELTPPEAKLADGKVTWQGQLASGASQTVAFDVTVNPGVPDDAKIVNDATALLREPVTGLDVTGEARSEDTVKCVEEIKHSEPQIDLRIWLQYVEFEDDMEGIGLRGNADMFGFSAVRFEDREDGQAEELGGEDNNIPDDWVEVKLEGEEGSADVGELIFQETLCCTNEDVELAVDFWDADPDDEEIVDWILEIAEAVEQALDDSRVTAAAAILRSLEEVLKELDLDEPDDLGSYDNLDLKTPWVKEPERFSCPLKDSVLDGERAELDRDQVNLDRAGKEDRYDLRLKVGGDLNGRFWLRWKGYPDLEAQEHGPGCNELKDGAGEGKAVQLVSGGSHPRSATNPALDLLSFSVLQANERDLDLAWRFEPLGGHRSLAEALSERGTITFHGVLTTPRNLQAGTPADGAQVWRTELHVSLVDGEVVAESAVSRWDEGEWIETGAESLGIEVGAKSVRATFDHRDIGELATYSVSAEVLEEDSLTDSVPDSPGEEYLLAWRADRMPPLVHAVRLVRSDVSEGPGGELLPRGSVDGIVVEFSERVELIPGDVRLEPSVDLDLTLEGEVLTVKPREVLAAGDYELFLAGGILDAAGNRLDGDVDGTPGDGFRYPFRVLGFRFFATDRDGMRKTLFTTEEAIHASGLGFDPSSAFDLYLMPAHQVSEGAVLEDFTSDDVTRVTAGPSGDLEAANVGSAREPGEYSLIADVDGDGRFDAAVDREWREPGIGVGVVEEGDEPEESEIPDPYEGPWLTSPDLPGFEAKVRITPQGHDPIIAAAEPFCIVESLCASGALPGRPEVFVKVIGPRPNGKLWTQVSRFTPSEVEVWLRQVATDTTRYYRLGPVGPLSDDVSGLQDRGAYDPAGAPSSVSRGALLPGAAVEPLPLASRVAALGPRLEPGEPEPPSGLDWLTTAKLPGFRFKALITPAGGSGVGGQGVEACIPETLCIQGALAGRPEVFAKIIGPRPNGFLWVQAARFTPSRVELWVEQEATGTVRYYRLAPIGPAAADVSGLQDREVFAP